VASINRTSGSEGSFEVFQLELNDEERVILLSAPVDFTRNVLESNGIPVNRIFVHESILNSLDCPDGYEVVHWLSSSLNSQSGIRCRLPM
jgi:hypothetical protein